MTERIPLLALALTIAAALVALAAFGLSSPASGKAGDGKDTQPISFNFDGTYRGNQRIKITGGNNHAREENFIGRTVRFDMALAIPDVADTNDDGYEDYRDIGVGDKVGVKTELPKNRLGKQPYPIRALVNNSHRAPRCGQGLFGAC